jgi:tellurite resistance protein
MMMIDGRIEPSEKRMIIDLNHRLTGRMLSMEEIDEHVEAVREAGRSAIDHARTVAPLLNDLGKELVLKAAFSVAVADRRIHGSERALLTGIGRALGLSATHVRSVVAESTAAAADLLAPPSRPPL